jgi:hypothetical protein
MELNKIVNRLPSDGLAAEEIVRELIRTNESIIREELEDIKRAGLVKIAGEVLRWRSRNIPSVQLDLFKEYDIPEKFPLRMPGKKKPIHKNLRDMTYADAKLYLEQHGRPRLPSGKVAEVARYLVFADSMNAKPHDKLLDIWERARRAGGGAA